MAIKEDIQEIKTDVKELKSIVQEALVRQAVLENQISAVSGKVNGLIAISLSIVSGLAYASWEWIKSRLNI